MGTWKILKFHLESNFYNFQERKIGNFFKLIATTFSPLELTLLDSMSISSELVLDSIILYVFLLHILLEREY